MIDELDRRLASWVQSVHKKIRVSFEPPKADATGSGVSLVPLDVAADPVARGPRRPPLRIRVRYLVSSWAEKPEEAHRLIGELVFAALDHDEYEVESDPAFAGHWRALGVPLRLGFLLKAPLRRERPERPVSLVREPLVFRSSSLRPLQGAVVGPDEMPIMGARVEVVSAGVSATTDRNGRFVLPPILKDVSPGTLRISAKGRTLDVPVPASSAKPLLIQLETLEH